MYDLVAVVIHIGSSLNRGHYISIVKSDGFWLLFDDDIVDVSIMTKILNMLVQLLVSCLVSCVSCIATGRYTSRSDIVCKTLDMLQTIVPTLYTYNVYIYCQGFANVSNCDLTTDFLPRYFFCDTFLGHFFSIVKHYPLTCKCHNH